MSDRLGDGQAPPVRQARSRHAGSAVRDGNEAVPLATQQPSSIAIFRTLCVIPFSRLWAMTFASSMTSCLGFGPALFQANLRSMSSSNVTMRNTFLGGGSAGRGSAGRGSAGHGSAGCGSAGCGAAGRGAAGPLTASWSITEGTGALEGGTMGTGGVEAGTVEAATLEATTAATGVETETEPREVEAGTVGTGTAETCSIGTAKQIGMAETVTVRAVARGTIGAERVAEPLSSVCHSAPAISGIKASGSSCTGDASCLGELELELSVETSRERQGDEGSVDDAAELTLMCCSTSLGDEGDDELAVAPSLPSCSSSLDPMAAISPMPAA